MSAGFHYDNDVKWVDGAGWWWKGAKPGGGYWLWTTSKWIYGDAAAIDSMEMMKVCLLNETTCLIVSLVCTLMI